MLADEPFSVVSHSIPALGRFGIGPGAAGKAAEAIGTQPGNGGSDHHCDEDAYPIAPPAPPAHRQSHGGRPHEPMPGAIPAERFCHGLPSGVLMREKPRLNGRIEKEGNTDA